MKPRFEPSEPFQIREGVFLYMPYVPMCLNTPCSIKSSDLMDI